MEADTTFPSSIYSIELPQDEPLPVAELDWSSCTYAPVTFNIPSEETRCWSLPMFEPSPSLPVFDENPISKVFALETEIVSESNFEDEPDNEFAGMTKERVLDLYKFGFIGEDKFRALMATYPVEEAPPEPASAPTVLVDIFGDDVQADAPTEPPQPTTQVEVMSLKSDTLDVLGFPVFVFADDPSPLKYAKISDPPSVAPWIAPRRHVYHDGILGLSVDVLLQSPHYTGIVSKREHKLALQAAIPCFIHINTILHEVTVSAAEPHLIDQALEKLWVLCRHRGSVLEYKPRVCHPGVLMHCYEDTAKRLESKCEVKLRMKGEQLMVSGSPVNTQRAIGYLDKLFVDMGSTQLDVYELYGDLYVHHLKVMQGLPPLPGAVATEQVPMPAFNWHFISRDAVMRECQVYLSEVYVGSEYQPSPLLNVCGHQDNVNKAIAIIRDAFASQLKLVIRFTTTEQANIVKSFIREVGAQSGCKANLVGIDCVLRGSMESIASCWRLLASLLSQYGTITVPVPNATLSKMLVGPQAADLKQLQAKMPRVSIFVDFKKQTVVLTGRTNDTEQAKTIVLQTLEELKEKQQQILLDQEKERKKGFFGKGCTVKVTRPTTSRGKTQSIK